MVVSQPVCLTDALFALAMFLLARYGRGLWFLDTIIYYWWRGLDGCENVVLNPLYILGSIYSEKAWLPLLVYSF